MRYLHLGEYDNMSKRITKIYQALKIEWLGSWQRWAKPGVGVWWFFSGIGVCFS